MRLTYGLCASLILMAACGDSGAPSIPPVEVGATLQRANELLTEEDWQSASLLLEELLEGAPETPVGWLLLAQAKRREGDYPRALEASATAAGFPQARGGALTQEFLTRAVSGDLVSAEKLAAALRTYPMIDFSGLHLSGELEPLREDERFAGLFPGDFDDPFVEEVRVVHDWHGSSRGQEFGWEARNVGDVDGDGAADAVVSAPGNQPGGDSAGALFVYSGRSGELLWEVGGEPGEQLGMGIEAAGDVNGDGVPDVASGAPGSERAYVFAGGDGTLLRTLDAVDGPGTGFGGKVAGTGDVDGDGTPDLVVGASRAAGGSGAAYLFSGADGALLARYAGEPGDALGSTVGGGGGLVIVGAPNAGEGRRGEVRVYRGLSTEPEFVIEALESGQQLGAMFVSAVGDVDADGELDVYASDWQDAANGPVTGRIYVHSGATGDRLFSIAGEGPGQGFGIGPARAGDVNGDGHDDLVVGAWQHGSAAHSGGKVYVYSGKDGELIESFTGKIAGETLGFDADGMGDVDGDGRADFLVTSAWSLIAGPRSGRAMIISGGAE